VEQVETLKCTKLAAVKKVLLTTPTSEVKQIATSSLTFDWTNINNITLASCLSIFLPFVHKENIYK